MKRNALAGCTPRWDAMFAENPAPVKIEPWPFRPSEESWGTGDRLVLCQAQGVGGRDLARSVVPG